ncbi:FecCD family ABC transporter permease [Frondihabitans australicus]|uniref:Iron complex transport system permease protein n=1 Tax=Frondihabitans australicus TaxID=386892 RepID=A0A495ICN7_9MICO|nr:iron chelate uptake ABC transporter family permease subunit [Frondihabitans australicus]RKR73773.1 iron complex transport system permease protein [Frondihabitans australicus]
MADTATAAPPRAGLSQSGPRRASPRARTLLPALALAGGVLLFAVFLSLSVGQQHVPLGTVWQALVSPGHAYDDTVVQSRIPRTLLGLLCGAALSVSGVVVQGLTRNPLGDPGLLGVNVGASATLVTGIAFFSAGTGQERVWLALPGAFAATAAVFALGSGRRGATPVRLVLAGAVITAVVGAYIQAVSLSYPQVFDDYRFWVVGSLAGRDASLVGQVLPYLVLGFALSAILPSSLNALALGDDTATALGAKVGRTRLIGGVAAALLCAGSTAAVGPISFVGLAVPHIVRSFTGADHRWLMPFSALVGPALLLLADVLGRVIAAPAEIEVGVITAFLGAPVLLLAVRRMRGRS